MTKTIIAIERDGLDLRVLPIVCEVPYQEFDLVSAARAAATDYCKTPDGLALYSDNCDSFNWADFNLSIPDEFCERHGFKKVGHSSGGIVVDWDEQLVNDFEIAMKRETRSVFEML